MSQRLAGVGVKRVLVNSELCERVNERGGKVAGGGGIGKIIHNTLPLRL